MPASPHKADNTSLKSKCISEPLSLIEFERKYSNQLPLQIMVLQGYQGQSPELSISTSDTYNIHFKKYRDVVAVRDNKGHIYSIPMGSALEFVLLNRPVGGNAKTTITTFEKVSDIPAHSTCPKVICATTPWSSTSDPKVSVEEGEVLVVKKPRLYGEKTLEVFSLTSKSAKVLPSNCKGSFSTDPSLTRLHLLDIVEHIPDVLPCEANLYVGDSDQELLPFCSGTLLLLAKMREASLVASNVPCESEQISQPPILLDIPLDDSFTEVEVVVIGSCDQSLYENTRKLIDNFATANVTSFKGSATQQTYETQSLLYETLREGYAHLGVELTDPELLYCGTSPTSTATEAAPSISPHQSSHFSSSKVDSEGYEIIDILDSSLHATLTETSSLPIPAPCHKVDRCHPPSHHQRAGSLLSPSSHGTTDQKQRPKASTRKGRKGNATPGRRLGSRPLPGNKTERLHDEAQELKTTVGTHASATPSVEFSRNMNRRYVATLSEDQVRTQNTNSLATHTFISYWFLFVHRHYRSWIRWDCLTTGKHSQSVGLLATSSLTLMTQVLKQSWESTSSSIG